MDPVTLSGRYADAATAQVAMQQLLDLHIPPRDLRVAAVMPDGLVPVRIEHQVMPGRGALYGAAVGMVAGAVGVLSMSVPSLAVETLVASGVLAGTAVGAAAGAVGGLGFWRSVARLDRVEDRARRYWIGARVPAHRAVDVRQALFDVGAEKLRTGPLPIAA